MLPAQAASLRARRHPPADPPRLHSQREKTRTQVPAASGQEGHLCRAGRPEGQQGEKKRLAHAATAGLAPTEEVTWGSGEKNQLQKQTGRWTSQAEVLSRGRFRFQNDKKGLFKGRLFQTSLICNGKSQWANQESERQAKMIKVCVCNTQMLKWLSLKDF